MADPASRRRWLALALELLALSALSICVRAFGYPEAVPRSLARAADWFAEPGLSLWWLTMGGVFQTFPSSAAGVCVAILGNALLWLAPAALIALVFRVARRALARPKH